MKWVARVGNEVGILHIRADFYKSAHFNKRLL